MATTSEYRRHDGVRITHDPFAPGMVEKYGRPGETDNEGFDPYGDSVGAGIYGGIVKRNPENGNVIIGKQYQNHNPRPGPVYAGGGYAVSAKALKSTAELENLLVKFPDLVNDVTTGGAQPLHMCGMSKRNEDKVDLLVANGADIEALDTYGMTPLHRMASNNLPVGARMLLEAGADLDNAGQIGAKPEVIAQQADAKQVLAVFREYRKKNKAQYMNTESNRVSHIEVSVPAEHEKTERASLNGRYNVKDGKHEIPVSFAKVCTQNGWPVDATWARLNGGRKWYQHENNNSYVYYNSGDSQWWIDGPSGLGIYVIKSGVNHAVPANGWQALSEENEESQPMVRTFRGTPLDKGSASSPSMTTATNSTDATPSVSTNEEL